VDGVAVIANLGRRGGRVLDAVAALRERAVGLAGAAVHVARRTKIALFRAVLDAVAALREELAVLASDHAAADAVFRVALLVTGELVIAASDEAVGGAAVVVDRVVVVAVL